MRRADVFVGDLKAGVLIENSKLNYEFVYDKDYDGPPVSLTLPTENRAYKFNSFPTFFEGLLPEGPQLEALLRQNKLNKGDLFGQLLVSGEDCVGAVSVKAAT